MPYNKKLTVVYVRLTTLAMLNRPS